MLSEKVKAIHQEAAAAFAAAKETKELYDLKVKFLGKQGQLSLVMREMGQLPKEEKPAFGKMVNEVKVALLPGSDFYMPETYLAVRVATVDYKGEELLRAAQQGASLDHKFVEQYATNLKNGCDRIQNFLQSLG